MKQWNSAADVSTVAFAWIKNQNLESALSNDCHTDYSKPNPVNYGKIQKRMNIGFKLHRKGGQNFFYEKGKKIVSNCLKIWYFFNRNTSELSLQFDTAGFGINNFNQWLRIMRYGTTFFFYGGQKQNLPNYSYSI